MAPFEGHDLVDGIDWLVGAPSAPMSAQGIDLDLDLGWLAEPSPSALARAAAARAESGVTFDFDLLESSVAPVGGVPAFDHDDHDFDLYRARLASSDSVHSVLFYDDESVWLREMVRFVADGIHEGEPVFLVLTPAMEQSLRAGLPGELVAAAELAGSFVIANAHDVLETVITDGTFDHGAFTDEIVPSIQKLYADHGGFRTSGQAVTLLWESGNVPAALELEHQWNVVQKSIPFTMLCAYPRTLVDDGAGGLELVTACHTEVHPV